MELGMRFQIAALLFFVVIIYDYAKNKHLPLLSTKIFSWMLFFAGFNIVCDIITVITVNNLEIIPAWINRYAHQCFIATLNTMVFSLFLYVDTLGKNQERLSIKRRVGFLKFIPYIFSMIFVLNGNLEYIETANGNYSMGPMAYVSYLNAFFYLIFILYNTHRYKATLAEKKKTFIRIGVAVWLLMALIQAIFPTLLLTGLGVVLMILFIYLSFENPKENVDEETASFNRRAFGLMLEEHMAAHKEFALVSVTLEDLARINSKNGYVVGADTLKRISENAQRIFRKPVYHSRGNVLSIITTDRQDLVKAQIDTMQVILAQSMTIDKMAVSVRAHIDWIPYCKKEKDVDVLWDAMNYMCDIQSMNEKDVPIRIYNESVQTKRKRQADVEDLIRKALADDGFMMVYQPIYCVKKGKFVSAEALVRLKDSQTLGFVSPDEFIGVAEKKGLIMQVGKVVFEKVCEFSRTHQLENNGMEYIEVNLSGIQCVDDELPAQLSDTMNTYSIEPSFMNLEITETAMIDSGEKLLTNMERLREMGCSFSMDDFGTGYSNLSQMADITYDLVKLDKSLIWPCFDSDNPNARAILESIVSMLQKLKVKIVAEGVETKQQTDYLSELGVDYLQGYYFSKPISGEDFVSFVTTKNTNL